MKVVEGVAICVSRKNKFLLIRRSPTDKMPYLWEFPGGAIKKNENKMDAARRELFEETGIRSRFLLYCGKYERCKKGVKTVIHFFLTKINKTKKIKLSKDHTKYFWLTRKECIKMEPSKKISIDAFKFLSNQNFEHILKVYEVLESLVKECQKNIKRKFSIILIGSYARGEFVPVWSDLDLIFFIQTKGKPLSTYVLKKLKENVEKSQKILKIPIWFKIHNEKTFFDNLSIDNLLGFYFEGNVIYGENVVKKLKKYMNKLNKERIAKSFKQLVVKDIYRIRYFYVGINKNNKELGSIHIDREKKDDHNLLLAGQIIDKVLEISQFLLSSRGRYISNKKDATEKFKEEFKSFKLNDIPLKFYKIRERWSKVNKKDIEFILTKGPEFAEKLLTLL